MKLRVSQLSVIMLALALTSCQTNVNVVAETGASSFVASKGVCPSAPQTVSDASLKAVFRHGVNDRFPLPLDQMQPGTVQFENLPNWLAYSPATGEIYGQAPDQTTSGELRFTGQSAGGASVFQTLMYQVHSDPLFMHAWHLLNIAQKNFALQPGSAGADLRATQTFANKYMGAGVRIAISDTAIDMKHEDLIENALIQDSRDYLASAPYTGCPPVTESHATSVAGIISARGWNNMGTRGVAPLAKFATFNYVDSDQYQSMALHQLDGNFDIFNQSFGVTTDEVVPLDLVYREKLKYGTTNLRNGRGAIYVKAAGNSFNTCQSTLCSQNASADPYNANPYTIVVGALTANDTKASYGTSGSSLWVSAYGGEYGDTNPAIMTTDIEGCSAGYSKSDATTNSFENSTSLNPDCKYTSRFNGTSAAAPMVSGTIALMLSANPNLKWRDVKKILADTARQVNSNFNSLILPQTGVAVEPGWITNAAGYKFHNWYGFGAVDSKAAVDRALAYTQSLPQLQETRTDIGGTWLFNSGSVNLSIPDKSNTGARSTISVPYDWVIEAIEVKVNIAHTHPPELSIELRSPSGTSNIILNPLNSFTQNDDLSGLVLLSNAFYGEFSSGTWTLIVRDALQDDVGQLKDWSINIVGHAR